MSQYLSQVYNSLENYLSASNFPMTPVQFMSIGERIIEHKDGNITNMMVPNGYDEWAPRIVLHDQEPLYYTGQKANWLRLWNSSNRLDNRAIILTSEMNSPELDAFCEFTGAIPCHWFSNGALALEWYDSHRMLLTDNLSNKLHYKFSCLNRLISMQRSYRPIIASFLQSTVRNDWLQLSCNVIDPVTKKHACDTEMNLPSHQRAILDKLREQTKPIMLNTMLSENKRGKIENHSFNPSSFYFDNTFCHIVTETLFYGPTLHLTEKSLRPIVNRRPFILVGPQGSLAYLRKYGFKTFSDFWNEDYDLIENDAERLDAVMDLIKTINDIPLPKMQEKLAAMKDVLAHNYDHFFSGFWKTCKDELTANLQACMDQLRPQFMPGLIYRSIEAMSEEEFQSYVVEENFVDDDQTLFDIMQKFDAHRLKIRTVTLCKQLIGPYNSPGNKKAGKEELLASLRRLMNK